MEPQELFTQLTDSLEKSASKIGLYLQNVGVGTSNPDPKEQEKVVSSMEELKRVLLSDEEDVFVMATFAIGDVAWSKRVLDPDQDKIDDEVRAILPDPVEMLKEQLRAAKEEGRDIFDLDLGGSLDDSQ